MHTPEQIAEWAREADMECGAESLYIGTAEDLTCFAALVAQHERERAAKICETEIREERVIHSPPMFINCKRIDVAKASPKHAAAIRNSDGG